MAHLLMYSLLFAVEIFTGRESGKKLKRCIRTESGKKRKKGRNTSLQFCVSALAFSMVAFEIKKILKAGKKQAKYVLHMRNNIYQIGMIVDDKYMSLGSANINHSPEGTSAMGAYQPHQNWARKGSNPSGQWFHDECTSSSIKGISYSFVVTGRIYCLEASKMGEARTHLMTRASVTGVASNIT
ncbi:phospholipase D gamma 1-like protein [Tanacetum coccineum]|uniref:Phospholipase D gamma 1-like protein n=1 Tax=Tanacetum coccineum TaxID=301880 RepID=A0ABQ5F0Z1_9ASTR